MTVDTVNNHKLLFFFLTREVGQISGNRDCFQVENITLQSSVQ